MSYVVIARWVARSGEEAAVLRALQELTTASRDEPGCRFYQPTRDIDDGRVFLLLEIYDDAEAYQAHAESEHFRRFAVADAIPRLERREREFYETIA